MNIVLNKYIAKCGMTTGTMIIISARSESLNTKENNNNYGFVSYNQACFHFTILSLMDWSGVDYLWIIVIFVSAVWTLILAAPFHCRGSISEK